MRYLPWAGIYGTFFMSDNSVITFRSLSNTQAFRQGFQKGQINNRRDAFEGSLMDIKRFILYLRNNNKKINCIFTKIMIDKCEQMFYSKKNRTFVPCEKGDYDNGKE